MPMIWYLFLNPRQVKAFFDSTLSLCLSMGSERKCKKVEFYGFIVSPLPNTANASGSWIDRENLVDFDNYRYFGIWFTSTGIAQFSLKQRALTGTRTKFVFFQFTQVHAGSPHSPKLKTDVLIIWHSGNLFAFLLCGGLEIP